LHLRPGEEGGIGIDGEFVEEGVGGYSGEGVEGEVVSVLEVVFEEVLLAWVDDGVDEVEVEGELGVGGEEGGDVGGGAAGGVGELAAVGALAYYYLYKFEDVGGEFALEWKDGARRRAEPLVEG